MAQFLKRVPGEAVFAVVMIALTAVITLGIGIPRLGYYHDDWYMLWSGASRGAGSMVSLFSTDRPFIGYIYSKVYRVLADNMYGWHLATLFWRIAGGVGFYWILNLVWPRYKRYFLLAAMLFVIYPGFLAEPNAATKFNHLLGYDAALFSIAFTLQAVKAHWKWWKYACFALSYLALAFYLWIYEYMLGLEVMRIVLLFWVFWQPGPRRAWTALKRVVLLYLPYLLVMGVFLYWRMFIYQSVRKTVDFWALISSYQTEPLSMFSRLAFQTVKDFFSASVFAWFVQPYHLLASTQYMTLFMALGIALVIVLMGIAAVSATRRMPVPEAEKETPTAMMLIGSLIVLAAVFPVVLSNRFIDLMDAYKAYALHPSAGALILLLGLLLFINPKLARPALVILLAYSAATQTLNTQSWADLWNVQRSFWWQVAWRAPHIAENTTVMANSPDGYGFQQDHEVWGPVNLIYYQDHRIDPALLSEVLDPSTVAKIKNGAVDSTTYVRDVFMPRDYKHLLLISQPTLNSCVHVIDGKMPAFSALERPLVKEAGRYSDLAYIDPAAHPAAPPTAIFGKEPEHGWCYTYEKAALARQAGDWQKISQLYDQAQISGLKPGDASEWFVFVEGLVNTGRVDEASQIVEQDIKTDPALNVSLCESLAAAPSYPASYGYHREQINQLVCP